MSLYENYNDYRDAWKNAKTKTPLVPLNLDIELSAVCNLRCPFCFITDKNYQSKKRKAFMDTELALMLISEAAEIGVPALKFNWRGEPTLHPDFSRIIKFAEKRDKFHDIIINTNGNCPDDAIPGLMYATKVVVSIDTFNSTKYSNLRKRGSLKNAVSTINYLLDYGHPNIWIQRVITKENEKENFCHVVMTDFGDKVKVSQHYCFDRNMLDSHSVSRAEGYKREYCGYPSQRIVVGTDGSVFPCCVDYNETMPLGKYPDKTLLHLWNDPFLCIIRHKLKTKEFDFAAGNACLKCTSYMAYKCEEKKEIEK